MYLTNSTILRVLASHVRAFRLPPSFSQQSEARHFVDRHLGRGELAELLRGQLSGLGRSVDEAHEAIAEALVGTDPTVDASATAEAPANSTLEVRALLDPVGQPLAAFAVPDEIVGEGSLSVDWLPLLVEAELVVDHECPLEEAS